jgi:amino acid transporter
MNFLPLHKSMSNMLEAFAISAFAVIAFLGRSIAERKNARPRSPWIALIATCSFAVLTVLLVPGLPE